ncbi:hypothetical protein C7T35_01190 [Variovorax sp. WS11]|nr:hypothetical protein C7T35_01190 [Variovorax sp. WS11]
MAVAAVEAKKPTHWGWLTEEVNRVRGMIERLPIFDLPSPTMVEHIGRVDRSLWALATLPRVHADSKRPEKDKEALEVIEDRKQEIDEALAACKVEIDRATNADQRMTY